MGKSKEQKQAERQQLQANDFFMQLARTMADLAKEREAKETAYLEGEVDPKLKGYAESGFAPGERERYRNIVSEDVGRSFQQAEKNVMRDLARTGYQADAPSGVNPYMKMQLARARGESKAAALRNVENYGADRRFNTVSSTMLARASRFNPLGYTGASYGGRPVQPRIEPGFWQKVGSGFAQQIPGMAMNAASGGLAKIGMPGMQTSGGP